MNTKLVMPITMEELKVIAKVMVIGKSFGPNGVVVEFLHLFLGPNGKGVFPNDQINNIVRPPTKRGQQRFGHSFI